MAPSPKPPSKGLAPMAEQTPTKSISTRLMTMKFMQRAAASQPTTPTTPASSEHSGKRQKISHSPLEAESPSTSLFDAQAARAAMKHEEKKREVAVARLAQQLGDSHWVLEDQNTSLPRKPLQVVQVGYAQIDSANDEHEVEAVAAQGKKRFGNALANDEHEVEVVAAQGKKRFGNTSAQKESESRQEKRRMSSVSGSENESSDSSSGSSSDSDSNSGDASEGEEETRSSRPSNRAESDRRSRSSFSQRREEERKKSKQFASNRRKKDMKLNRPMSISSAGQGVRYK